MPDATVTVATADGTRLVVDRWASLGTPPPCSGVLLVHGLASNARLWDGVATELRRMGHPVAAVDLRGHGRSDKPDQGYDMASVASDVADVIGSFSDDPWDRPVVVGQSWGGNVVVELGWRCPELVAGLVCVDGGVIDLRSRFEHDGAARQALAPPPLAGTAARDLEAQLRSGHRGWADWAVDATMANFECRTDGTVAPWLSFEHHMAVLDGLWHHRPFERFAELTVPVLLLMADDGTATTWSADKRAAVEAALANPSVEARWFEPADHDLHAQLPGEVADAVHRASLIWHGASEPLGASGAP